MRHRRLTKHFSRKSGPRKALLRNLVVSLVEHERIKTTLPKAKELRRHIERAITRGKGGTLADFRLLLSKYPSEPTVNKIIKEISPRFADRNGGYTRIIKLGTRPGDRAEMAFIEFVDYDYEAALQKRQQPKTVKLRDGKNKLVEKQMTPEEFEKYQQKVQLRRAAAKRTAARKRASAARKVLRSALA
jgi:large subunit ribosomal protein L17